MCVKKIQKIMNLPTIGDQLWKVPYEDFIYIKERFYDLCTLKNVPRKWSQIVQGEKLSMNDIRVFSQILNVSESTIYALDFDFMAAVADMRASIEEDQFRNYNLRAA